MIEHVNIMSSTVKAMAALGLLAALAACRPGETDPQKMQSVLDRNAAMREEIGEMEANIARAGDHDPALQEKVAEVEARLAESYREADTLEHRGSELDVRLLELQDRLDSFLNEFKQMQANLATPLQP